MIGTITRQPVTIGIGVALGLMAAAATVPLVHFGAESYDVAFPVLSLRAVVLSSTPAEVVLKVTGEKRRECQYVRLQAYTVHPGGQLHDAMIARTDQHEDRDNKPVGSFDFGTWRIWPRDDAIAVRVYSQHVCSGRMTVTKVIDMALQK